MIEFEIFGGVSARNEVSAGDSFEWVGALEQALITAGTCKCSWNAKIFIVGDISNEEVMRLQGEMEKCKQEGRETVAIHLHDKIEYGNGFKPNLQIAFDGKFPKPPATDDPEQTMKFTHQLVRFSLFLYLAKNLFAQQSIKNLFFDEGILQLSEGGKPKKILVVDDDAFFRDAILKDALQLKGYSVVTEKNAPDGLSRFKQALDAKEPFAAVITDHQMPRIGSDRVVTGDDLAAEIQRLVQFVPIVKITGSHFESTISDEKSTSRFSAVMDKGAVNLTLLTEAIGAILLLNSITSQRRILLVEDMEEVRNVTKLILERFGGHEVISASSGEEGIKEFLTAKKEGRSFDLLIIDQIMKMMGSEFAEKIRELDANVPMVKYTGNDAGEGFADGTADNRHFADVIYKSTDTIEFCKKISQALLKQAMPEYARTQAQAINSQTANAATRKAFPQRENTSPLIAGAKILTQK